MSVLAQQYDTFSDTWVCCDALGRPLVTAHDRVAISKATDEGAEVGMFYYLWHGCHGKETKDITKLLEKDAYHPEWGDTGQFHWGSEPLLGYYKGGDAFIIAKHMQMLMDAGIDFYFFDATNGFTYDDNVRAVMREIDRREKLHLRVPKLAFMVHSVSVQTAKHIYDTFYKDADNDKYWYTWDGKPLMLVNKDEANELPEEIRQKFSLRYSWAWEGGKQKWPWLEHYPQREGFMKDKEGNRIIEQISVSTSQHPYSKIGKSFHNGKQPDIDTYGLCKETPYGYYFDEQWKRALQVHPKVVMVTQWNEWMAQRFIINNEDEVERIRPGHKGKVGETYFVDVYNQEFNRDIEPSKGPLIQDNYYLQLVSNVRQYKGARPLPLIPLSKKKINVSKDFSQWDNVEVEYRDEPGDCEFTSRTAQKEATFDRPTNDITTCKVSMDKKNCTFMVSTASTLIAPTPRTYWMTLLINSDCNYSNGWAGYDYMVTHNEGKYQLLRYAAGKWVYVKDVAFQKAEKQLMLQISRKDILQRKGHSTFDFKWIDNIGQEDMDVLDFIGNGEAAPNGRMNYRVKLK